MEYAAPADLCQRLRRCNPLLLAGEVRRNHTAAIRRSYRGVAWLSPDSLCARAASAGRRGSEEVRARLGVFRIAQTRLNRPEYKTKNRCLVIRSLQEMRANSLGVTNESDHSVGRG